MTHLQEQLFHRFRCQNQKHPEMEIGIALTQQPFIRMLILQTILSVLPTGADASKSGRFPNSRGRG